VHLIPSEHPFTEVAKALFAVPTVAFRVWYHIRHAGYRHAVVRGDLYLILNEVRPCQRSGFSTVRSRRVASGSVVPYFSIRCYV
jgi:hypothetical protein